MTFCPEDVTGHLLIAILAGAFGSAFQHGYNTGVLNEVQNVTMLWIKGCKGDTGQDDCVNTEVETTFIWAWIVSIFCLGGMVGGLSVGMAGKMLGRKRALLLNNLFVLIGGGMMMAAKYLDTFTVLIGGRFFIGISAGFAAGLAPMYLSEISPPSVRGAIGTIYQLIITVSILISQLLGLSSLLGTQDLWPYLLAATMVPGLIQVLTLPFCPESPSYLYMEKDDEQGAIKSLQWLGNKVDVSEELATIQREKESQQKDTVSCMGLFRTKSLRKPLMIAVMMMLAQQLTGINAIIFYSTDVFSGAGLSHDNAQYATIGLGLANVCMTILAIFIIDRAGRKTLLLIGIGGMLVSTICLFACLLLSQKDSSASAEEPKKEDDDDDANSNQGSFLSIFSIVSLVSYIMFFAIGPGPIPWFLTSELFSQNARPAATSIAVGVNWFANFVVSWGFQPVAAAIGPHVFLVFLVTMSFFMFYIWYYVPETKDKTIVEITAQFK